MLLACLPLPPSRADLMHWPTVVRSHDPVPSCCTRVACCVSGVSDWWAAVQQKKRNKRAKGRVSPAAAPSSGQVMSSEIPLAVAHRRSRQTLHGPVRHCSRWKSHRRGTLGLWLITGRSDLDLVLPPESNDGAISQGNPAMRACQARGCTSSQSRPSFCSLGKWGHTQVGLVDQMLPDSRQVGSSIPLPRCRSPDVSHAPHAACHRFRCGWRPQPLRNGRTGQIGHLPTPCGVAAVATYRQSEC